MSAEIAGASMFTEVLDLQVDKKFPLANINSCIDEILKDAKNTESWWISEIGRKHLGKSFSAVDVICPLGRPRARAKLRGMHFPKQVLSDPRPEPMFWHLLTAPVIGGQVYKLPSLSAEEWVDKQTRKNGTDLAAWGRACGRSKGHERKNSDTSSDVLCQG